MALASCRGSSHNHGFIWSKDGPVLVVDDLESRRAFAQFWGVHVSGILPINVDRALEERTAMSLPPENDQNTLRQLDMLVNSLQRHICTPSYCVTYTLRYQIARLSNYSLLKIHAPRGVKQIKCKI
jgi:hypothetical protein